MKKFNCPKCESKNLFLKNKGDSADLYCGDCGEWIKWVAKDEILVILHHLAKRK